ncbi:2-oxo-4-hydroxy-4-carboxy-5-ureidoimidazoline decarboxylase [Paraflavisolibacter sp. H34]|uniref:2-oxo-4-hydroxy-4-carboxy-5-ureidoimidazoline decarboxylase n=1 Tax=Huijunlia imazamoxiresistens TaxID=3127457 RepID=UPI00301A857A
MTLSELNNLSPGERIKALSACCGATAWQEKVNAAFPLADEEDLFREAEKAWASCSPQDWKEAFAHHPKIGDLASLKKKFASTAQWAAGEQAGVQHTSPAVLEALAAGNRAYEEKFGYIFIVCATGKTAEEMLHLLQARLPNDPETEIAIAAGEQNKITLIRLQKLLAS